MSDPQDTAAILADRVAALDAPAPRNLIAVAGPPASGKSTLARALCDMLNARSSPAGLVAMDGFHLDNPILDARGLRPRKGAPETFDLAGFAALLHRLQTEGEVIAPTFDRDRDVSVGSSAIIAPQMTNVVVEGNYLLLTDPGWRDLHPLWTLSVLLAPPLDVIEERLMQRWRDHGFAEDAARHKTRANDLPNAKAVLERSAAPDLLLET